MNIAVGNYGNKGKHKQVYNKKANPAYMHPASVFH